MNIIGMTAQKIYDSLHLQYEQDAKKLDEKIVSVEELRAKAERETQKITLDSTIDQLKTSENSFLILKHQLDKALERTKIFENDLQKSIDHFKTFTFPADSIKTLENLDPDLAQKAIDLHSTAFKHLGTLTSYHKNIQAIRLRFEDRLPRAVKALSTFCDKIKAQEDIVKGTGSGLFMSTLFSIKSVFVSSELPTLPSLPEEMSSTSSKKPEATTTSSKVDTLQTPEKPMTSTGSSAIPPKTPSKSTTTLANISAKKPALPSEKPKIAMPAPARQPAKKSEECKESSVSVEPLI